MQRKLLNFCIKMQSLVMREEGQDLIEYALLVAMMAFGAAVSMDSVATHINTAFSNMAGVLSSDMT
jgi:pilus assembly protein Flp/PilA